MTPEEFDACFDRFTTSTFRLEGLPEYNVGGDEADRLDAFRRGEPRPERTIRNNSWLTRIARTVIGDGLVWQRVHVVDEPLSDYLRYELLGYVESQAVGEQVRIATRSENSALAGLPEDYWLFDGGTPHAYAVAMNYDSMGHILGFELVTDPGQLVAYEHVRQRVWNAADQGRKSTLGTAS